METRGRRGGERRKKNGGLPVKRSKSLSQTQTQEEAGAHRSGTLLVLALKIRPRCTKIAETLLGLLP